jgi:hypothetical protein
MGMFEYAHHIVVMQKKAQEAGMKVTLSEKQTTFVKLFKKMVQAETINATEVKVVKKKKKPSVPGVMVSHRSDESTSSRISVSHIIDILSSD